MANDSFYKSSEWWKLRNRTLRQHGYVCQMCGASLRGKGNARVDHIVPITRAWERRLDPTNLRCLCPSCDNKRHREKGYDQNKPQYDANGFPPEWQ